MPVIKPVETLPADTLPVTASDTNVPTDVILGCAAVVSVPVNKVADTLLADIFVVVKLPEDKFAPTNKFPATPAPPLTTSAPLVVEVAAVVGVTLIVVLSIIILFAKVCEVAPVDPNVGVCKSILVTVPAPVLVPDAIVRFPPILSVPTAFPALTVSAPPDPVEEFPPPLKTIVAPVAVLFPALRDNEPPNPVPFPPPAATLMLPPEELVVPPSPADKFKFPPCPVPLPVPELTFMVPPAELSVFCIEPFMFKFPPVVLTEFKFAATTLLFAYKILVAKLPVAALKLRFAFAPNSLFAVPLPSTNIGKNVPVVSNVTTLKSLTLAYVTFKFATRVVLETVKGAIPVLTFDVNLLAVTNVVEFKLPTFAFPLTVKSLGVAAKSNVKSGEAPNKFKLLYCTIVFEPAATALPLEPSAKEITLPPSV